MPKKNTRRDFLKASCLLIPVSIGGDISLLPPAVAKEKGAEFSLLSPTQVESVEILGEHLVPGSQKAGLAHFIDSQLSVDASNSLLMIRYLGVPAPYSDFYLPCLNEFTRLYKQRSNQSSGSNQEVLNKLIADIASGKATSWSGPPSDFFYFLFRSDAVDVTYGTERGFESLNTSYMAHIKPENNW